MQQFPRRVVAASDGSTVVLRRRDPLGPRRPPRPDADRRRVGRPSTTPRCTCTSPSRSPRTRPASRRTARRPPRSWRQAGALGERTSVVHATHLTGRDVALLGGSRTRACFCPTTERDLGDGIGPSRALHDGRRRAHPGLGQPRGRRPVRGDAGRRARRAARHPERGHWSADELLLAATSRRARVARLRRRPDRGRGACRPGHPRHRQRPHGRAPAPTRAPPSSPRRGADVTRVLRDGVDVTRDPADVGAELDRVIRRLLA